MPIVPVADKELVITIGAGAMVRTRVAVPVPPALVAVMTTELVPVVAGVPEIRPVEEFTLNPEGRPVAE